MTNEAEGAESWGKVIEGMKAGVERQLKDIEFIEGKVSDEIAIHHRDFHSVIKGARKALRDIMKDLEALESGKIDQKEAILLYRKMFADMKKIDEDLTVAQLSTIAIQRTVADYYFTKKKFSGYFNEIGKLLSRGEIDNEEYQELAKIHKENAKVVKILDDVIEPLGKATHKMVPRGDLINAAAALCKILEDEEVKDWVTSWIAGYRKSAKGAQE